MSNNHPIPTVSSNTTTSNRNDGNNNNHDLLTPISPTTTTTSESTNSVWNTVEYWEDISESIVRITTAGFAGSLIGLAKERSYEQHYASSSYTTAAAAATTTTETTIPTTSRATNHLHHDNLSLRQVSQLVDHPQTCLHLQKKMVLLMRHQQEQDRNHQYMPERSQFP